MKRVMLAVDGSSDSDAAALFLAGLPHAEPMEVVVLTVLQSPALIHASAAAGWAEAITQRERSAANETFERICQPFTEAGIPIRHETREGKPAETIVGAAETLDVDLVILGAKGQSKLSRLLLGSTSDYVATRAPCSVMVVRPAEVPFDKGRPLKIVIGCDDSEPAQAAIEEFVETLTGSSVEAHVVSILCCLFGFFGEIPLDSDVGPDSESVKRMNATLSQAVSRIGKACRRAEAHLVEHEHIGEGLAQFAREQKCDLLIVGETPQSYLGKILLGSVSRYVLRHAPCSVWITRSCMRRGSGPRRS